MVVSIPGDYGKPRPALVVQSDEFNGTHASVSVAPITTTLIDAPLFRITIDPSLATGLRAVSQIMIDKVTPMRRDRLGKPIGEVDDATMLRVNRALALWLGIGS